MTKKEQKFEKYVDDILNKLSAMNTNYIETCEDVKHLLLIKGKEYRRNNNPYHNFEVGEYFEHRKGTCVRVNCL